MCFFRKKKVADKVKDDRELIAANSKAIEALVVLAKDNVGLIDALKEVQEKIYKFNKENKGCQRAKPAAIFIFRVLLTC